MIRLSESRHVLPTTLAIAALLPSAAFAEDPRDAELAEMKAMMGEMSATIRSLEQKVSTLEKKNAETPEPRHAGNPPRPSASKPTTNAVDPPALLRLADPPPASHPSRVAYEDMFTESQNSAPRLENRPVDPEMKGFFEIPGTKTRLKVGGYARVDAIADDGNNGNPNLFSPSSFPMPGQAGHDSGGRSQIHTKASRLTFEVRRPVDVDEDLRVYYENDFFNDSSSSSASYRLRHLYGQAYNVLVGQTFSAFMDPDSMPDVLDYQGPNALLNKRSPQLRYTHPLDGEDGFYHLAVSLEQPSAEIGVTDPVFPAGSQSFNRTPDFAAHLRWEDKEIGHLQLGAVVRSLSYESPMGDDEALGWGLSLGGHLNLFEKDRLYFQTTYGEGIGRYIQDLGGQNVDAALDGRGDLEALPAFAAALGYKHHWSERWSSTVSGGYVNLDPGDLSNPYTFDSSWYASANLMYQPSSSFRLGLEYLFGSKQTRNDLDSDGQRLNFVLKYDLVK